MLKVDVRFVVGGKVYRLKEEVASKFKKAAVTASVAGLLVFGSVHALAAMEVNSVEVTYEQVFIGADGVASSAAGAINALNANADYRDLLHYFEEKNDVEKAGHIEEGMYYVPVIAQK